MFQTAKNYMLKKLVQSQLDTMPPEARPFIMNLVENHPDLLQQIAIDIQAEMATGKDQQAAIMVVMKKHESHLKGILK